MLRVHVLIGASRNGEKQLRLGAKQRLLLIKRTMRRCSA
jgi:hypothetical protein